jgi:hypothetical protein
MNKQIYSAERTEKLLAEKLKAHEDAKNLKAKDDLMGLGAQYLYTNDPVGLPDDADVENLNTLIKTYDTANPGVIKGIVQQAKEQAAMNHNDFGAVKDKNLNLRHTLTLPADLMKLIEKSYPIMFTNKKHLAWFKRHYSMFMTSKRS